MKVNQKYIDTIISNALSEDKGSGDITTLAICKKKQSAKGIIRFKQDGIICGQKVARAVFRKLNSGTKYKIIRDDGQKVKNDAMIAEVYADYLTLLSAERVALNFLMHLSGIATYTSLFVAAVRGTKARILDTRKTIPGLRLLEKYAVKTGGGENHRIGLYDMYLIKDNHIETAGSIKKAVERCLGHRGRKKTKIEIEVKSIDQIKQALEFKIDRIMLDNMSPYRMKQAVSLIRSLNKNIEIEASGNVNLRNVRRIAQSGVDYISIGALTHSAPSADISMDIQVNA